MGLEFELLRGVVRNSLVNWHRHSWTLQGLGMLRAYYSEGVRLHVWSQEHRTENMDDADLHDHPWDFESCILAGDMVNQMFTNHERGLPGEPIAMDRYRLCCGQGAVSGPETVPIWPFKTKRYKAGDTYTQDKGIIHRTIASEGCVSIIKRKFYDDRDTAHCFTPVGRPYVNAASRKATDEEVSRICAAALRAMGDE